jgi:hypothetical protein
MRESPRRGECDQTFGMDFENYIVGPLYEGRGNYQMDHPGFVAGLAEVRGRIRELGWREALVSEIDGQIRDEQWRRHETPDRIERYGKKYGWIAYYELAGRLDDRGELRDQPWGPDRGVWPDIDPSFPETPTALKVPIPPWASGAPDEDESWVREGEIDIPDELLAPDAVDGEEGPWLLVEGFLKHRDRARGRRVFGFFRGFLVEAANADQLRTQLSERPYLGNDFVPVAQRTEAHSPAKFPGIPGLPRAVSWKTAWPLLRAGS